MKKLEKEKARQDMLKKLEKEATATLTTTAKPHEPNHTAHAVTTGDGHAKSHADHKAAPIDKHVHKKAEHAANASSGKAAATKKEAANAPAVQLTMWVRGIDYHALAAKPSLRKAFEAAVAKEVAHDAVVEAKDIQVKLSSGSIVVKVSFAIPPGKTATEELFRLTRPQAELVDRMKWKVVALPGIDSVKTDDISVVVLDAKERSEVPTLSKNTTNATASDANSTSDKANATADVNVSENATTHEATTILEHVHHKVVPITPVGIWPVDRREVPLHVYTMRR